MSLNYSKYTLPIQTPYQEPVAHLFTLNGKSQSSGIRYSQTGPFLWQWTWKETSDPTSVFLAAALSRGRKGVTYHACKGWVMLALCIYIGLTTLPDGNKLVASASFFLKREWHLLQSPRLLTSRADISISLPLSELQWATARKSLSISAGLW